MHEMWPIVVYDPGVCQFPCQAASLGFGVQKRLNGSRSCLGRPDPPAARGLGGGKFDAAFAKLVWPLVYFILQLAG